MGSLTYPYAPQEGTLTAEDVHRLLNSPRLIARRVADLANQKFIADYLLAGRFVAAAGGVFYDDQGAQIYAPDNPRQIPAGGEYPLTIMTEGELQAAKTVKWGLDTEVYDERINALGIQPVNVALVRMVNSTIRYVDGVALAVVASKVTRTVAAGAAWTTGGQIVESVLVAKATGDSGTAASDYAYDMDTVVLKPVAHAKVLAFLINGGLLPRESANVVAGASAPVDALGLTWATSYNVPFSDPLLVDRKQLGGMADENIGSPGYARASAPGAVGVETKVQRLVGSDDRDGYRARCRRVTVPVVTDPNAAIRITGTGI